MEEKKTSDTKKHESKKDIPLKNSLVFLIVIVAALMIFNQWQLSSISNGLGGGSSSGFGGGNLGDIDITAITTTAQGINLLFPLDKIKTAEDAIAVIIPTGTPEYGEAMGVSFDEPVDSMEAMAKAYPALNEQVQKNPSAWGRYLGLASEPRGVSCEFCCGVGPTGVTKDGKSKCGCQHHPAVLALTLWLLENTDYSDAEILREVYKWKAMFFPKNMVGLAVQIAGGDQSVLKDLPGMVGGC